MSRRLTRPTCAVLGLVGLLAFVVPASGQIVGPDQMNACETAAFTTTITNESVSQDACLLTITRSYTEAGVVYVPGSTTITLHDATVLTDDPAGDAWDLDALVGDAYALPPGESITVAYDLETTCAAVSGTEQVTVDFEDCDDPGVPLQNVSSTSIEILPGAIVVSKMPSVQDARVGENVTWTITVENTGLGRVSNLSITDVLGPGLAYRSSTGGGSNVGQTTTWDGGSLDVGATVSVDLTAEVVSCAGLYNDVDAAFGCGPSDVCFDTAVDEGTATASLNLIVDNPALSFTPPNVTVGYCTDETAGLVQIVNSDAGTARNVELCCDIAHLEVDPTRLPPDTTYIDGCFQIPDIAPGATFDLTFYLLHADVDWCTGGPGGDNVFQLTYTNDCDIPFVAYPQFSTCSSESGPSLDVTKSGPDSLRLGETGSYVITVEYSGSVDCGGGSPGPITIVDTYPEGFTVVDPAGGTVDGGARTITWGYDPNVDPPFAETIRLEAPTDCGYCAQPGASASNSLTATGTDCCGCPILGTAEAETILLCEGDAGTYFSSSMALDRSTTIRCSADYAVTVTHTYTFANDAALADFLLNEYLYFVDGNGDLAYVPGSATVTGGTLGAVVDNTPAGQLELPLTDATTVQGKTIVYEYTLIVQDLDSPSCQPSTIPIHAGVELLAGAPELGLCNTMYTDPPAPVVTAQPPAMSVSIAGIPEIQEFCATYPVTITLTRTSALAQPYDARLVLTDNGGSVLDFSGANCAGGTYSPTDGTTCTAPIVSGNTYEWRYADLFDNENDTAQIVFDVTIPCSGPLADLSVVGYYDDLCHDDGVYGDACSTSSADEALLSLSANVFTRKSPEILYATTRDVEWTLVVHNTGNGAAYNVWLDDTLGSGLVFDQANTVAPGATVTANQDHLGGVINGATFLFDRVDPGQLIEITFAADLVACSGLTNDIAVSWGCGESDCQVPRTDDSAVVIPPAKLVATSFSPTPVPMCADNTAVATVKNAGIATVYNVVDTVTLPAGLQYLGNPEVQVNGGAWSSTGEPAVAGQTLTWTKAETPELASAQPKDVIKIRFAYTAFCGFQGGNLEFQATYENPCGDARPSNIGRFALGLTPADVTVTLRQTSPAPGESIDCGGQATWEIDVENVGSVLIPVVEVEAVLGDGLTYVSSDGDPTYGPADGGTSAGQSVRWELTGLPVDAIATLQVIAVTANSGFDCDALDIDVDAAWGCGEVDGVSSTSDADCTTTSPATGTISAVRRPPLDLTASLSPGSIEACAATTELTLTITNDSAVATTSNVDFVITLPAELSYVGGSSEIDCGSGYGAAADPNATGQTLTWYDIGADGGASDGCESIPPGGTIRLRFDVDVSCFFTTQDIPITVYSYDCCGLTQYDASTSVTLTSLLPALTVDKSPVNTNLDCYDAGDTVTWTLTVTNNGTGIADWVRLVDTLGSSLVVDSFTDLVDEAPSTVAVGSQVGQTITWEADISLAPGESLSATVTAHAIRPSDDCSRSIRRNTAVATWGCGTLAAPTCEYGTAVQDVSTVRVPNLDIDPADIVPVFSCAGDGITPGSGRLQITVRNQGNGDAPITEDFSITVTEPNSTFSITDTFVGLGGTLPLGDESSQTLTLDGWNVSCANCTYAVTVTLDAGDTICECAENDNAATLNGSITLPDLVVASADLNVSCAGDGQIRIEGPVTLRNDGCGDPVTEDLRLRFRVFDAPGCAGNEIDTFTETWSSVSIASDGGALERPVDRTRSLALCGLTELSILVEADEDDAVCECSGANNTLCVGPFSLALPDVAIQNVTVDVPVACAEGSVDVTVRNEGSGDAPAGVVVRVTGDATGETTTPLLAPGGSTVVAVPLDAPLPCGPTSITVTVDPDSAACECSDGSNTAVADFTVSDPDLVVGDLVATCQPDGTIRVTATVANDGDESSGDVAVRVLLDGSPIDTATVALAPAETYAVDLTTDPVACGVEHTIRVDVDQGDAICECDETNNALEASATCPCPALSVDKIVTDILRKGSSVGDTGPIEPGDVIFYRYTIQNVGAGTALNVDFADTLPAGLVTETDAPGNAGTWTVDVPSASGPLAIADGVDAFATSIAATIDGGGTLTADYSVIATSDVTQGTALVNVAAATGERPDGSAIPGENADLGDTSDADAEDPDPDDTGITELGVVEPALSVDKTIADIVRPRDGGRSLGAGEPVEPGDIVSYRFVIRNVGDATAYDVEFADTLPPGMVTVAGGTYSVSSPAASGTLALPDGVGVFATSIDATIDGGGTLTADFDARITSEIVQGVDLVNTAEATGVDGFGTEIPDENPAAGDTSDDDVEDPDPDDVGIAVIGTEEPALSVDKVIADIVRRGSSVGNTGPVEPGDVIFYRYTIRNVGLGTAYHVEFTDTLPAGLVTETDAPGDAGSWTVDDPSASGALGVPDAAGAFTTSIDATLAGGGELVADYTVYVTSDVSQGVDLVNVAAAVGVDGAGNPIPGENADVGDTSDDDEEDPDPDDTGITAVAPVVPALDVDKRVVDVIRGGASVGVVDPVLFGDVVVYAYTIRNVGLGTAYGVDFTDTLPPGLEIETGTAVGAGSYSVDAPAASGSLALLDGATAFATAIDAEIAGGGTLTATYAALVRSDAPPAIDLVNTAEATGEDGAGTEIPDENANVGDTSDTDAEDPDPDDTGIASVRVGAPALATTKSVLSIVRDGFPTGGETVEPGDAVTYAVTVTNVGDGPAQNVDLVDRLPVGFRYEGPTDATWPSGTSTADPTGVPGPVLAWPLGATLDASETLTLQFVSRVTSDIAQGASYTNEVTATGDDATGQPIPPDASDVVPADDDPDDASDATLVGAVPALVTEKRVHDIVRDSRSVGPSASIETGDLVIYDLRITNVGDGTAYDVDALDTLPSSFAYRSGTTEGTWPVRLGTYAADPLGAPGPTLAWETGATLGSRESLALRFTASIDGPIDPGTPYTNTLSATGLDGGGRTIPPNRAAEVPDDVDPDDRDDVTLTGSAAVPALVTTKAVFEIRRDGVRVTDRHVEEGDVVRFELTVKNVGEATAYAVGIEDTLPAEFQYEAGSTSAQWPAGSWFADPARSGGALSWALGATLRTGARIVLRFDAVAVGPLFDGNVYVNRMRAFGRDDAGAPIPPDQRSLVPSDTDPDDASGALLIARSSVVQGEGGEIIPVPILRKQATILREGVCEGLLADADRLWFQTDIAMYAAAEFERLAAGEGTDDVRPDTLLPTWLRTVRTEAADYALDNLVQVQALSKVGLTLAEAPRTVALAADCGVSIEAALELRLREIASRAGLDPDGRPAGERWIVLEYAGGEPIYTSIADGDLGPYGDWTILDERLVGSALGMGLVKQAIEATTLVRSDDPLDRYVGLVLAEAMANKVLTLDESLTAREGAAGAYVPHEHVVDDAGGFPIQDASSHLFDQLALLWGLAEFATFTQARPDAWSPDERGLRAYLNARSIQLISEILSAIENRHVAASGALIDVVDRSGAAGDAATTVHLGLLLVALDRAGRVVGPFDAGRIASLALAAADQLAARASDGRFREAGPEPSADLWALAAQLAGIRGLLVAAEITGDDRLVMTAQAAFDALDENLWNARIGRGLYAAYRIDGTFVHCYTPLDVGLAVGALRELAARSTEPRRSEILSRLASFVRAVVDDAALQLANAVPLGGELTVGDGRGTIGALRYDGADGPLAPVLQQRLCLDAPDGDLPCAGRSARRDDPWYQTDVSMYAAFAIQDRAPAIEDVADANLSAVVFHSGLGIRFAEIPALEEIVDEALATTALAPAGTVDEALAAGALTFAPSVDPIAVPFFAGSPALDEADALRWNRGTFDDRVVASAVGMTLLREAQEVRQLLDRLDDPRAVFQARLLVAAIVEKVSTLEELVAAGPDGVEYVPHAARWNAGAADAWTIVDVRSTLFDQLSLLYGLTETRALFADARVADLVRAAPTEPTDPSEAADRLAAIVLATLERIHLDAVERVLVDEASPESGRWTTNGTVTTAALGLTAAALERAVDALPERLGARARALLDDEIGFLDRVLWVSSGVYREAWTAGAPGVGDCREDSLLGQLGALRALLAGHRVLDLDAAHVVEAVRAIDARFWDDDAQLYRGALGPTAWCATPLALGLAVDALDRSAALLDAEGARRLRDRLSRHLDRVLDGLRLQLPESNVRTDIGESAERFAPVFDRRVCVRPATSDGGATWAEAGDLVRYTIAAENPTEETFTALALVDRLPEGVTLLSADPAGTAGDGTISWSFDRLAPSEARAWSIDVRVDEGVAVGTVFENCATLTYTDPAGAAGPTREACASVTILDAAEALRDAVDRVDVTYETDGAMRLATILEELARDGADGGFASAIAHEVSVANLGVLVGESALGLPMAEAPTISASGESLDAILASFANAAGLPVVPSLGAPIFLPFESGTPVLRRRDGFVERADTVSPAALGWTLAREALFLDRDPTDGRLDAYLRRVVGFVVENQIAWLAGAVASADEDAAYLPRAARTAVVDGTVVLTPVDRATTAYGQASLLLGLTRIAEVPSLDDGTRRLALELASATFDRLSAHWNPETSEVARVLPGDGEERATWGETAVVAAALEAASRVLERDPSDALGLLRSIADAAAAVGPLARPIDEAGRLTTLARAGRALDDRRFVTAVSDGWSALRRFVYDARFERLVFSPRVAVGWTYTPEELAIVFEALHEIRRTSPEERAAILADADRILRADVIELRVQLVDPIGFWQTHTVSDCFGLAPVFAWHFDDLPPRR